MDEPLLVLLRVVVSLACVVGLIVIIGRKLAGTHGRRTPAGPTLSVVGRQALGRHAGIAVVAVGNRRLLLGYGEQQVTMLSELAPVYDAPDLGPHSAAPALRADTTLPLTPLSTPQHVTLPTPRTPLDIDALLVQARLDATRSEQPATGTALPTGGALDGSILAPSTWRQALRALQDRTVRR